MLDFRSKTKSKKTPYGPEVSRWLWLLFLLGLVLIVGGRAMEPETWRFIAQGLLRLGTGQQPTIDNRLPHQQKEAPSEAILMLPAEEVSSVEKRTTTDLPQTPVLAQEDLEKIQDDFPLRRAEMDAWRRLFQVLHETDEAVLEKRSEGVLSYGQLFRQSKAYRGRLVTVRGQLRRVHRVGMPSNSWGQEHYYQTWLQPADQPSCPMQIYCLELPEGFPLGMKIDEPVEVTGFYFKRAVYQAHDGLRTTPTLAAKTVRWTPRPIVAPEQPSLTGLPLVLILVIVALLGAATAVVMYYRVRPKGRFHVPRVVDFQAVTQQIEKAATSGSQTSAPASSSDS